MTDGQLSLPFQTADVPTADVPCPTCRGAGDVYYLANRPDVIGGKRVVCPSCGGTRAIQVPISSRAAGSLVKGSVIACDCDSLVGRHSP